MIKDELTLTNKVVKEQQSEEELKLDGPVSEEGNANKEREIIILTYVDHSFGQDLTFIDGLVKTRFRSLSSGPSQL